MARVFDWHQPAKLFFWPASDGADEAAIYPTLGDALQASGEGDLSVAWIVTRNGDILSPRLIQSLREERAQVPRRRRSVAQSVFGWAKAA